MKSLFLTLLLSSFAVGSFAQAAQPEPAASSPKHKPLRKLKSHKPVTPAVNPATSSDKKGGA